VKFGITGNVERKAILEAVRGVIHTLDRQNISFVIEDEFARSLNLPVEGVPRSELGAVSDMLLAFGGDGTLLYIAKTLGEHEIPILGINAGHLEFLTEMTPEELPSKIYDLIEKRYTVEKRIMIEAKTDSSGSQQILAVNDIFIDRSNYERMIKLALTIDNEMCHTYIANGIIISTATGSTAYSLSAGGPILYPTIDNLLINPIYPHTLSARPMVIPGDFTIEIELQSGPEEVPLNADGHIVTMLKPGNKIFIRKSSSVLNLVHLPSHSFFKVLSTKLGWGTRNEISNSDSAKDSHAQV